MSRPFEWPEFVFLVLAVRWTLLLSLVAFVCGGLIGLAIALARVGRLRVLRWLAIGYIQLFQGTPLLMQLFLVYYGVAVLFDLRIEPWPAVAIAFTLYASAFLGEIWRAAIQAVPRGHREAAQALGLAVLPVLVLVVLPQAFRIAIPSTVGFLVQIIKGTAVASLIGFIELTRAGQLMTNVTFEPMLVYPIVAALYFALCWPLSLAAQALERRADLKLGTLKHI